MISIPLEALVVILITLQSLQSYFSITTPNNISCYKYSCFYLQRRIMESILQSYKMDFNSVSQVTLISKLLCGTYFVFHNFKQRTALSEVINFSFQVLKSLPFLQCFRQFSDPLKSTTRKKKYFILNNHHPPLNCTIH